MPVNGTVGIGNIAFVSGIIFNLKLGDAFLIGPHIVIQMLQTEFTAQVANFSFFVRA